MTDLDEIHQTAEQALHSPAAERAVIYCALINPDVVKDIDLRPEHFYQSKYRTMWAIIKGLDERGTNPDYITVGNELDKQGKMQEIGGVVALSEMVVPDGNTNTYFAEEYSKIVKEKASRRKLIQIANKTAALALDKDSNLDKVAELMTEMANLEHAEHGAQHWGKFLAQADEYITERANNPGKVWGISTGISAYDEIAGGLQERELRILSGDPGIGKSFYILQEATHMASQGIPGALYSLEMTGLSVSMRALNIESGVKSRTMRTGGMSAEEWDTYYKALEHLTSLPVYMSDSENWTTVTLRADMARLKRNHNISWAMVDYSYLLKDRQELDETQRSQIVASACKSIAKSLGISLTLIHSKNKAGMGEDGSMGTLRGSGQVVYDADVILTLTNPDKNNQNVVRGTFLKGRELEDSRKYFDLVRLNGNPKYQPVITKRTQL